ncbi:MAG: hypothetical protein KDC61_17745, partial [Saprospiraceae bacterium]|nr:hypothetical protein [Saprospiraceae bacterium]
ALSCWRLWPRSSQPKIMLMKMLAPVVSSLYGYYPGNTLHFMRDMPKGVVTEFSNWCNLPNGLFDLFPDNNYRKLSIPILAYSFADDWFSPVKAVSALLEHFKNARIRWLHLQPSEVGKSAIGHDGFFEPGNESLWQDMIDWIGKPEPAKGYFY